MLPLLGLTAIAVTRPETSPKGARLWIGWGPIAVQVPPIGATLLAEAWAAVPPPGACAVRCAGLKVGRGLATIGFARWNVVDAPPARRGIRLGRDVDRTLPIATFAAAVLPLRIVALADGLAETVSGSAPVRSAATAANAASLGFAVSPPSTVALPPRGQPKYTRGPRRSRGGLCPEKGPPDWPTIRKSAWRDRARYRSPARRFRANEWSAARPPPAPMSRIHRSVPSRSSWRHRLSSRCDTRRHPGPTPGRRGGPRPTMPPPVPSPGSRRSSPSIASR